jgi:hypothetical protein
MGVWDQGKRFAENGKEFHSTGNLFEITLLGRARVPAVSDSILPLFVGKIAITVRFSG